MNCEYCQSPVHIWFQCPKKPDGWKPARLAKKSTASGTDRTDSHTPAGAAGKRRSSELAVSGAKVQSLDPAGLAGTALPVDTNPGRARATEVIVPSAEGATLSPGAKFDKKAWMKANMPAYMKKYRADVKAGKRVPKKREC